MGKRSRALWLSISAFSFSDRERKRPTGQGIGPGGGAGGEPLAPVRGALPFREGGGSKAFRYLKGGEPSCLQMFPIRIDILNASNEGIKRH